MSILNRLINIFLKGSLVRNISVGLIIGLIVVGIGKPLESSLGFNLASQFSLLGEIFVKGLRAIAPILVFVLVMSAIANKRPTESDKSTGTIRNVIILYLIGTFCAALTAVLASFIFPSTLTLITNSQSINPPHGVGEVLQTLLYNIVDNPISALYNGNFIGILAWAIGLGIALRYASEATKNVVNDLAEAVTMVVKVVIAFAPLGVFGLLTTTLASKGLGELLKYGHLLLVLIGSMLFVAFVINPIIVYWKIRSNPYPLIWIAIRESGLMAFFTRSSAANIPVNLNLSEKLNLDEETYSVTIPLGATINMAGAAITITVLTLATVNTLGIQVNILTALLLSIIASLSACGASGVAGGSLLLIPLACSLFGISQDIAAQVIAVGFIIGVLQDSTETALNSSTDVVFTASACMEAERLGRLK